MATPPIEWIVRGPLLNEGSRTASYPYNKLCTIRRPEDCRSAALEESEPFEREFGEELARAFYNLLWYLNTRAAVFTSHCAFSSTAFQPNRRPGIGAHIIVLSRRYADWPSLDCNTALLNTLGHRLANYALQQNRIQGFGQWIRLLPVHANYYCRVVDENDRLLIETPNDPQLGYGCQIEICAMGDSRQEAAKRWNWTCGFVLEALAPLSKLVGWESTAPFDHDRHFPFAQKGL